MNIRQGITWIAVLALTMLAFFGVGCTDGDDAIGTQFAALTDESRSACLDRCEEADVPQERCEQACADQRQDPCYEECRESGKTGEACREECADASDEGGLSAEEIAAYEACHDACVEGGKDPIECREECSP